MEQSWYAVDDSFHFIQILHFFVYLPQQTQAAEYWNTPPDTPNTYQSYNH